METWAMQHLLSMDKGCVYGRRNNRIVTRPEETIPLATRTRRTRIDVSVMHPGIYDVEIRNGNKVTTLPLVT